MKLVKAFMVVVAIGAVNFAHADGDTCLNRQDAPRGKTNEEKTAEALRSLESQPAQKAGDSSTST